jgi:hypothetical protein
MALQEELFQIEGSLWTNDAELYETVYTPDAVLIFPEVGKIGTSVALDAIRQRTGREGVGRKYASRK